MAIPSGYSAELLREGGEFNLYRGMEIDNQMPILAVEVTADDPSSQGLRRLEHECSLGGELDAAWAAQPLALTRQHGRATLILRDPGGEPLDSLIERRKGQGLDLTWFLSIANGLTSALSEAHRKGIIHKDVRPANALVDRSGRTWLMGFGIASRLPRERLSPAPPEIIAGTLAYMSPEQTGRMNRSLDTRSDLYSLGVTLYEMLTGTLPFAACDPLEWVHCHIARWPATPTDRRAVPEILSAIVMRLLAKNPDERYQTAVGLESDLRRCLAEWQSDGQLRSFQLGLADVPHTLLIPEKLYGREREVDALLAAFERVLAHKATELILVSGYSGVGKSSVVNELHKALVPPRAHFAIGKFEQYQRDVPYATLAQAFRTLVRQILVKSDPEVGRWRRSLLEALGNNGQLLMTLIPELVFVIGEQAPVVELPPQEARARFHLVLKRLLGAFATPEHPLALFLDDLQWIDTETLDLLEDLVTDADSRSVLLIGAYRDNEVGASHPLARTLAAIREARARIQEIVLSPLSADDVARLTADALRSGNRLTRPLADLVYERTGGNPFFTIQLLKELEEEGLLWFSPRSAIWNWEVDRIHEKGYTGNVVDLMVGKLSRFSEDTQVSLRQLACLGNGAEFAVLRAVYGDSTERIHDQLSEAIRAGLVYRTEVSYRFAHDRVQEAAYLLVPEEQRALAHLQIGRRLVESTPKDLLEEAIFDVVNQLNRGSRLMSDVGERGRTAELNLIAGRRAKASTAYVSALSYLRAGRELLSEDPWGDHYDLVFAIETLIAECELHTAELGTVEGRLKMLAQRARSAHDTAVVTRLQITLYTTSDRSDRAIDVFLDYLRCSGTDWSRHPTQDVVLQEYNRIWSLVGKREIEDLVDLPLLEDPDVLDMLDVFTEMVHPAMFFDENLSTLAVCRLASLCLEHGNCDAACFGYVWFGMFAGPRFNNYEDGFRFGQLGHQLVEKRNLTRYQARTYISFGTLTPWARHAMEGRELFRRAFVVAHRTGDLTFSAYGWHALITNYLAVGDPLAVVLSEVEEGLRFLRKAGFGLVIENCAAQLGLIRTLRGLTTTFGSFDSFDYDELETERRLAKNPLLALAEFFYWTRKLQARFISGDYASAVEASLRAHLLLWPAASQVETGDFRFYAALAHAAAWNTATFEEKREHVANLTDHYRQLETWALHCPANFRTKAALVGAEIARIEGRVVDAENLYEAAIGAARDNNFPHYEAAANECAAEFYTARGFAKIALLYWRDASESYRRWGATAKVRQIEERHPEVRARGSSFVPGTIFASVDQLDLATVMRISEAVSGEIEQDKLVGTLIRTAIEYAGARRGLLILARGDGYQIEAEATASLTGITVTRRQSEVNDTELPTAVLQFAMRTGESLLLHDAGSEGSFTTDEYIRQHRARSILCLPIVKQRELVGALYLENDLSANVFTPDRVAVLKLLTSQASFSLENAALYADLQLQVELLQLLPASAWTLKPDGTPDFVNKVWLEFAGHTLDFVRSHPEAWMIAVHPEDREIAAKSFWEGVQSGQDFAFETRSLRAQDGIYRWHLQKAVALRDAEGNVLKFVGTTIDIDDQKHAEAALRQAQDDLARVNRVSTMGELAASLAHEVSQPISGVITNGSVSLRKLSREEPDVEGARVALERIVRDAHRAAEILDRIRSQFQKSSPRKQPLNVNEIILETVMLLRSESVRHGISVRTELASDLPEVNGDRVQLQQVAMNLIVNGIEAMRDFDRTRELVIKSACGERGRVLVSVSDTGAGVAPEVAAQIFEPFFTTKLHGTGMGLRMSRSIVESHGGHLWVASTTGPGATFQFDIPGTIQHLRESR